MERQWAIFGAVFCGLISISMGAADFRTGALVLAIAAAVSAAVFVRAI